jgi:hypothetical protein
MALACFERRLTMQQVIDIPECDFCHSIDLTLFYDKPSGLIVQCAECGYSRVPANAHLSSDSITLLAG